MTKHDAISWFVVFGCAWLVIMLAFGLAQLAALR